MALQRRDFVVGTGALISASMLTQACGRASSSPRPMSATNTNDPPIIVALRYGVTAPSAHNTQPWLIDLVSDTEALLHVDPERLLPKTDPPSRQVHISHGTFVELTAIGATHCGYRADVELLPLGDTAGAVATKPTARIRLVSPSSRQEDPLLAEVRNRRTSRLPYEGPMITETELERILSHADSKSMRVSLIPEDRIAEALDIVVEAMTVEVNDFALYDETRHWFRFSKREVRDRKDGLSINTTGLTGFAAGSANVTMLRNPQWQYDFRARGERYRKSGFRTKAQALAAEKRAQEDAMSDRQRITLAAAYEMYMEAGRRRMKPLARDHWERRWPLIEPVLGHLYLDEIKTLEMDRLKQSLPAHYAPATVNHHLALVRAVLRFALTRELIDTIPHVPTERVIRKQPKWYTEQERDRLLAGMYEMQPRWYCFFYLTTRLGLRTGEVYAISRDRIRDIPPMLIVDRAVQRGYQDRPAELGSRKNNETYSVALAPDVFEVIHWHDSQGYAGPDFLFSEDSTFPKYLDSHKRPLRTVQKALGLPLLSHHQIGRHSMASQAATNGLPIKALQAQLGHRSPQSTEVYAHLGNRAQLRLVRALEPASPPHRGQYLVNENER